MDWSHSWIFSNLQSRSFTTCHVVTLHFEIGTLRRNFLVGFQTSSMESTWSSGQPSKVLRDTPPRTPVLSWLPCADRIVNIVSPQNAEDPPPFLNNALENAGIRACSLEVRVSLMHQGPERLAGNQLLLLEFPVAWLEYANHPPRGLSGLISRNLARG